MDPTLADLRRATADVDEMAAYAHAPMCSEFIANHIALFVAAETARLASLAHEEAQERSKSDTPLTITAEDAKRALARRNYPFEVPLIHGSRIVSEAAFKAKMSD